MKKYTENMQKKFFCSFFTNLKFFIVHFAEGQLGEPNSGYVLGLYHFSMWKRPVPGYKSSWNKNLATKLHESL